MQVEKYISTEESTKNLVIEQKQDRSKGRFKIKEKNITLFAIKKQITQEDYDEQDIVIKKLWNTQVIIEYRIVQKLIKGVKDISHENENY